MTVLFDSNPVIGECYNLFHVVNETAVNGELKKLFFRETKMGTKRIALFADEDGNEFEREYAIIGVNHE